VAALFATSATHNKDGVLWAMEPARANEVLTGQRSVLLPDSPPIAALANAAFGPSPDQDVPRAAAIMPTHVDRRLSAQLAGFTIHGTATPLEELAGADSFLLKFGSDLGFYDLDTIGRGFCTSVLSQSVRRNAVQPEVTVDGVRCDDSRLSIIE
jgi:hypothetical protein